MTDQIPNITRAIACLAGADGQRHCSLYGVLIAEAARLAPTLTVEMAARMWTPEHYALAGAILRELSPRETSTAASICECAKLSVKYGACTEVTPLERFLIDVTAEEPEAEAAQLIAVWDGVADTNKELGPFASADAVCEIVIDSAAPSLTLDATTFTTAALLALRLLRA